MQNFEVDIAILSEQNKDVQPFELVGWAVPGSNGKGEVQYITELLVRIVASMFPDQPEPVRAVSLPLNQYPDVPFISEEQLIRAYKKVGHTKEPGPDYVPNITFKAALRSRPEILTQAYTCPLEGVFPCRCQLQKLVLLPKGNKPPTDSSSYRPIYLLDSAEKIVERIFAK